MATKIFPSVNDVNGGTAGQGKTMTEANEISMAGVPYFGSSYVSSGMGGSNGGGLNLTVATGIACINGYFVQLTASSSVLLTASATNYVWLQLLFDGSNNVTGTTFVATTSPAVQSNAVLVAVVSTGASTITTITASHRGIIMPAWQLSNGYIAGASSGTAAGQHDLWGPMTVVGDGVTPVRLDAAVLLTNQSTVTAGNVTAALASGPNLSGTLYRSVSEPSTQYYIGAECSITDCIIAPWVGIKSFYLNGAAATSGGATTFTTSNPTGRAFWVPGATPNF